MVVAAAPCPIKAAGVQKSEIKSLTTDSGRNPYVRTYLAVFIELYFRHAKSSWQLHDVRIVMKRALPASLCAAAQKHVQGLGRACMAPADRAARRFRSGPPSRPIRRSRGTMRRQRISAGRASPAPLHPVRPRANRARAKLASVIALRGRLRGSWGSDAPAPSSVSRSVSRVRDCPLRRCKLARNASASRRSRASFSSAMLSSCGQGGSRARPGPRVTDMRCPRSVAGREMVLPVRIELTTSALPRMRSTTELRQHAARGKNQIPARTRPGLWPRAPGFVKRVTVSPRI